MAFSAVTTIISFLLVLFLIYYKDTMKSAFLIFLSIAIFLNLVGNHYEINNDALPVVIANMQIRLTGVPFIPTLWYLCVREFCGLHFKKKFPALLLLLAPLCLVILSWTWQQNHLLISGVHYGNQFNKGNLFIEAGPLGVVQMLYQHGTNIWGLITLVVCIKNGTKHFRKQAALFVFSTLIPFFNTMTYMARFGQYHLDITPFCLLGAMLLFTVAQYQVGVMNRSSIVKDHAMQNLQEGLILFDQVGVYMDSNLAAKKLFPQLYNVPLGTSLDEMHYLPFASSKKLNDSEAGSPSQEFIITEGSVKKTFSMSISSIYRKDKVIGHSIIFNDITTLKNSLSALKEKSVTDPLTKIFNREYWFDAGNAVFLQSKRSKDVFSVIMLDIDHFKNVNDSYGHLFGDYVLITLAAICKSKLRKSDILARYGGEELCILLQDTPKGVAVEKAEILRKAIQDYPFESQGVKTSVTASFGVAAFTQLTSQFVDIVHQADENLYKAKAGGRNQVCG